MNIFKKKQGNSDNQTLIVRKNNKKTLKVVLLSLLFVFLLIVGTIFFLIRIPSKYCGTYVRYFYYYGEKAKYSYKVSPLSIKKTIEYPEDDKQIEKVEKLKYYKRGADIIVDDGFSEKYLIIDDDCLYLESSKDISLSKKYGTFYWNEMSEHSDLYEIESKADGLEYSIETVVNSWARDLIYGVVEEEVGSSSFYILSSDEETDKTDLNTYEVKFKAAGGELSLYYDRRTKELDHIRFYGSVSSGLYSYNFDSMKVDDLYDCRAMLLAIMYILYSDSEGKLKESIINLNTVDDLVVRTVVSFDFTDLFANVKVDSQYKDRITYSLDNDRYSISFSSWISSSLYSTYGSISFSIYVK